LEHIRGFISIFMSAISNCTLYSRDHASVDELAKKAYAILIDHLRENGLESLEIMIVEDDLIANKTPVREIGVHGINLVKRLKRKGLSRVDFLKGIAFSEIKQFIADMALTGKETAAYQHIKTGVVDVSAGGLKIDDDFDLEGLARFTEKQIEAVKEVYHTISPFKKLNVAGLEEIVINFIITFKREANLLKLISPVKSYSEYTYTHATNVAVLSMFQAENLGMRDDLLRDIGIAALLHDVGKLFISKDVLEKKGSLDEREWQEIRQHPLNGARYLANIDGIPRLAAIAALEHHLRYDGKGYPQMRIAVKQQHLCSQIVAISDVFDALRSRRPYRRALEAKEILALMKKDSGSAFNSMLLDRFILTLHKALSE
jgi:HD-GYP domain-containing protein (c-di-GMP phosphodiesterase class II)